MTALPDEYQTATLVNGLPVATFRAQPYHRTITNILVGNGVTSTVTVYRGQIGSVPVAQNSIGASNTLSGSISVPAGQAIYVVWSAADTTVSNAFARVSWTTSTNPFQGDDNPTSAVWDVNAVSSFTIPTGATTGPRIVMGDDIPPELVTWANANNIVLKACQRFYWNDTDYEFKAVGSLNVPPFITNPCTLRGTYDTTNGAYILEEIENVGAGKIHQTLGAAGYNSFPLRLATQNLSLYIKDPAANGGVNEFFNYASNNNISAPIRADDGSGGAEVWRTISPLSNGWTGTLKILKVASPPNGLCIAGTLGAGTKTDGTVVATLPAGFRPANSQDIYATAFNGTPSTTQNPHFNILPDGSVKVFGIGTCSGCNVNGLISLDF